MREGRGYRPRHHEFRRGGDGGGKADDRDERGGAADDALGRGVHQERRAARGADCEAPGGGEPGEHLLLREAVHWEEDVGG